MLSRIKLHLRRYGRSLAGPFKLLAFDLKTRAGNKRSRRIIDAYFASPGTKRLHIGCGKNDFKGWLNTDLRTDLPWVCVMDATKPFPLPSGVFEHVYNEHMIEHITHAAGQAMLRECHRVMKPGGRIRIATPDLSQILGLYAGENSEQQKRYLKWSSDRYMAGELPAEPAYVINNFFQSWGHRFIYDRAALSAALASAGFAEMSFHRAGESDDEVFRGIERHHESIGSEEWNQFETIVCEAWKPVSVPTGETGTGEPKVTVTLYPVSGAKTGEQTAASGG